MEHNLNPNKFDPILQRMIRFHIKNRQTKLYLQSFAEVYDLLEKGHQDAANNRALKECKKQNRLLTEYKETAAYDHHVDGMVIHSLIQLLEDNNVPKTQVMQHACDANHEKWTDSQGQLHPDVALSVGGLFDDVGGAGSLQNLNNNWDQRNSAPNPQINPPNPPAYALFNPSGGSVNPGSSEGAPACLHASSSGSSHNMEGVEIYWNF